MYIQKPTTDIYILTYCALAIRERLKVAAHFSYQHVKHGTVCHWNKKSQPLNILDHPFREPDVFSSFILIFNYLLSVVCLYILNF